MNVAHTDSPSLKAHKDKILIEPVASGYSKHWESHHATNPCVIRLSRDPRVFLGYRAGGDDDYYRFGVHHVWGSHLGLAILHETGQSVQHRLALPIMTIDRDIALPQTEEEYEQFKQGPHYNDILVLHDFRFFEHQNYLYVIYHEGPIHDCYDCIVRMPIESFLKKVDESIALMNRPVEDILPDWRRLWWTEDVWQPAGVNGTNRLFASPVNKGDIVFFMLGNGRIQMNHRPLADAIAVLDTDCNLFAQASSDGLTTYGTCESCIRPGYIDNSHIGSNGSPTRARIGTVDVYIDVVHGVHNRKISEADIEHDAMRYYPYLRVKDYQTGEILYYSENPVLDYDDTWREYAEEGTWVSQLDHLDGVMFAGGQLEAVVGQNGLDDTFLAYTGLGDTAVGLIRFTLRELLPPGVIDDIIVRHEHQRAAVSDIPANTFCFPRPINGWDWTLSNHPAGRNLQIVRTLNTDQLTEQHARIVNTAPGYFDADAMIFDGQSIRLIDKLGWVVVYQGIRWDSRNGRKVSTAAHGILILDPQNPEKILYRSTTPVGEQQSELNRWDVLHDLDGAAAILENVEHYIPAKVLFEIERLHELERRGLSAMAMQMITWQRHKSGLLDRDKRFSFTTDTLD